MGSTLRLSIIYVGITYSFALYSNVEYTVLAMFKAKPLYMETTFDYELRLYQDEKSNPNDPHKVPARGGYFLTIVSSLASSTPGHHRGRPFVWSATRSVGGSILYNEQDKVRVDLVNGRITGITFDGVKVSFEIPDKQSSRPKKCEEAIKPSNPAGSSQEQ